MKKINYARIWKKAKTQWLLLVIFVMFIAASIFIKGFFSPYNLTNILNNSAILGMITFGLTFVIILGKIDIAVGSIISFTGVLIGILLSAGVPTLLTILIAITCGGLFGLLAGLLIGKLKLDFWIVSFSMMGIIAGLALVLSNGGVVPCTNDIIKFIGVGDVAGISFPILIYALVALFSLYLFYKSKYGYDLLSTGGSYNVARLSGINADKIIILAFVLSGIYAAISGVLLVGKSNSANPIAGNGYEFNAIAAAVLGGTPFEGGKGTIMGSILGAVFMTMLKNVLNLLGFSAPIQYMAIGLIIMTVVIVDALRTKAENRKLGKE